MLHLIPAPLHRQLLRLAHAARTIYWRRARPRVNGCRILALDPQGQVLLIRHTYGSGRWMPPGGGLARGESPLDAACRELREETGCELLGPREVRSAVENLHGARNRVHVVVGRTRDAARADRREVAEAGFFPVEALPAGMPFDLAQRIPGWLALYRDHSSES